jgi:hypothetical protein
VPTSLPAQRTAPSAPAAPAQPILPLPILPLLPGLGGILGPHAGPAPLLPPLLGGLLGDWWPSADWGASLATLDLWGAP